jgi:hypothetical protein
LRQRRQQQCDPVRIPIDEQGPERTPFGTKSRGQGSYVAGAVGQLCPHHFFKQRTVAGVGQPWDV